MSRELEVRLRRGARKLRLGKRRTRAYVYGTLARLKRKARRRG